jgi:hypothetical protein
MLGGRSFALCGVISLCLATATCAGRPRASLPVSAVSEALLSRCELRWHETYLDHFSRV